MVNLDHPDPLDPRVNEVPRVNAVNPDHRELEANLDHRALKATVVKLDLLDQLDNVEKQVPLELLAKPVNVVNLDQLDLLAHLDPLDQLVSAAR